ERSIATLKGRKARAAVRIWTTVIPRTTRTRIRPKIRWPFNPFPQNSLLQRVKSRCVRWVLLGGCLLAKVGILNREESGMRTWIRVMFIVVPVVSSSIFLGLGQKQPKGNVPSSVAWKAPVEGQSGDYVGAEACASCHPVQSDQFNKSIHAKAAPKDVKYGAQCESCHGPGKAHIQAIEDSAGDDEKIAAAKKLIFGFHGK